MTDFVAAQGADAIRELLKNTNVKELSQKLRTEMKETTSEAKKKTVSQTAKNY